MSGTSRISLLEMEAKVVCLVLTAAGALENAGAVRVILIEKEIIAGQVQHPIRVEHIGQLEFGVFRRGDQRLFF